MYKTKKLGLAQISRAAVREAGGSSHTQKRASLAQGECECWNAVQGLIFL